MLHTLPSVEQKPLTTIALLPAALLALSNEQAEVGRRTSEQIVSLYRATLETTATQADVDSLATAVKGWNKGDAAQRSAYQRASEFRVLFAPLWFQRGAETFDSVCAELTYVDIVKLLREERKEERIERRANIAAAVAENAIKAAIGNNPEQIAAAIDAAKFQARHKRDRAEAIKVAVNKAAEIMLHLTQEEMTEALAQFAGACERARHTQVAAAFVDATKEENEREAAKAAAAKLGAAKAA